MHEETALIATIAGGLGLAFLFGLLAVRLRMPPLVGYLLAGVAVGPFTPGFVADTGLAAQLAEIGVILLMFGVGLHFSPEDLLAVRGSPYRARSSRSRPPRCSACRLAPLGMAWDPASSSAWPLGREHRRAPAGARGPRRAQTGRDASRSAGSSSKTSSRCSSSCCSPRSRARWAGPGEPPPTGSPGRGDHLDTGQGRGLRRPHARRGPRCPLAARARGPDGFARALHARRPRRGARHRLRGASSSASRSRSAPFSRAWWSASPISPPRPPPKRCHFRTRSPCSSSSPSGCCSIR